MDTLTYNILQEHLGASQIINRSNLTTNKKWAKVEVESPPRYLNMLQKNQRIRVYKCKCRNFKKEYKYIYIYMWLWNFDVQYISITTLMWHVHSFYRLTFACQALWWEGRGLCRRWTFCIAEPSFRKRPVSGCAVTLTSDQGSPLSIHSESGILHLFLQLVGPTLIKVLSGTWWSQGTSTLVAELCAPAAESFDPGSNDGCWKSGIQGRLVCQGVTDISERSSPTSCRCHLEIHNLPQTRRDIRMFPSCHGTAYRSSFLEQRTCRSTSRSSSFWRPCGRRKLWIS